MIREVEGSGPNEQVYESERGRLIIRDLGPTTILFVEQGFLEKGFAPHIERAMNAIVARNIRGTKPTIFVDAEALGGYEPEIQTSATQWIKANKTRVTAQHMLVSSMITRMGLSVASLALGGIIKGYTSRADFEAAMKVATSGYAASA